MSTIVTAPLNERSNYGWRFTMTTINGKSHITVEIVKLK